MLILSTGRLEQKTFSINSFRPGRPFGDAGRLSAGGKRRLVPPVDGGQLLLCAPPCSGDLDSDKAGNRPTPCAGRARLPAGGRGWPRGREQPTAWRLKRTEPARVLRGSLWGTACESGMFAETVSNPRVPSWSPDSFHGPRWTLAPRFNADLVRRPDAEQDAGTGTQLAVAVLLRFLPTRVFWVRCGDELPRTVGAGERAAGSPRPRGRSAWPSSRALS